MHWCRLHLLALFALAAFSHSVLFEEIPPTKWAVGGIPSPDAVLSFRVALRSPNVDAFEQGLMAVSDPYDVKYGQHYSQQELKDLLRADQAAEAVTQWLSVSGVDLHGISSDGDWVKFKATIAQAEDLMNTTFHIYTSPIDGREVIRTLRYSVPDDIASHVDLIHPTTRFPQLRPARDGILRTAILGSVSNAVNASCTQSMTPSCLQHLYNINNYSLSPNISAVGFLGVSGFLEQYARYTDITSFLQTFAPAAAGSTFNWTSINGGVLNQNDSNDSSEANLDMEYTMSLTFPLPVNFYSTAGLGELVLDNDEPAEADDQNEPYLDQLTYLLNLPDGQLPHTLSTSYGEDEQSIPPSYAQKVCAMFGALGLRGVSVIFSSGDLGVGSACEANDGTNRTRFNPQFPASCPWVTAVGATTSIAPEAAATFSSGGFSDRWPRPWWQQNSVVDYLDKLGNEKWAGLYNPWGRAIPDVAAQGTNFVVVDKGLTLTLSGTSCAAPTFASVIALINALKVQAGQSPLGFLNPWLYLRASSALNDITVGGSTGCTGKDVFSGLTTPYVPYASWNATEGWDPVTGLGTPDFQKLLKSAMAAPFEKHGGRGDNKIECDS